MDNQPQAESSSESLTLDQAAKLYARAQSPAPAEKSQPEETPEPPQQDDEEATAESADADEDAPDDESDNAEPDADADEQPVEPVEEIEYEGKKYSVPAELKEAFLRQQDYTRKTMETAEQRKALEAKHSAADALFNDLHVFGQYIGQLQQVDAQLQSAHGINWQELRINDPIEYALRQSDYRTLLDQRGAIIGQLEQAKHKKSQLDSQRLAEAAKEAEPVVRKAIPNWGPDVQKAIASYAVAQGYQPDELATLVDPRHVLMLNKAMLYDQAKARAPAAAAKVKNVPPAVRTVQPGSAKAAEAPRQNRQLAERFAKSGSLEDAVALYRSKMK